MKKNNPYGKNLFRKPTNKEMLVFAIGMRTTKGWFTNMGDDEAVIAVQMMLRDKQLYKHTVVDFARIQAIVTKKSEENKDDGVSKTGIPAERK